MAASRTMAGTFGLMVRRETQERLAQEEAETGILQTWPGLSPLPFCYLNAASLLEPEAFPNADTRPPPSLPDDPALLRIEGPIATITLNRPAAFNSIDLSIAKKLEQLGAEVEANRRHQGAGDRRRRPRLLRRRRSADHRRGRRSRHHRARGRRIAQALSRLHRDRAADAEDRAVQRSRLGGRRGHGARLRHRPLHRRRGRPLHAGLRQDRRIAGWRQHRRHGRHRRHPPRLADISGRRQLFRAAGLRLGSGRQGRSGGRTEGRDPEIRRAAGAKSAGRDRRHQVAGLPGRAYPDQAAARRRGRRRSSTPCTPTNSAWR